MNRWMSRIVSVASLAGAVALVPAGVALAQQTSASQPGGHHGHRMGLVGQALALDSLTPAQRTAIEQLVQTRRTAEGDTGPHADHRGAGKAWMDSFRGDAFNASSAGAGAKAGIEHRADRMEDLLTAAVPVLSPAQRAQLATHLRARAAHESHS